MHCLQNGFGLFLNAHPGATPDDPAELFPDYVSDPLCFYHPGDSDPPPDTIDNSVPNAPNSARISFAWLNLEDCCALDEVFIQDNTEENNGGQFINMLTLDGLIETEPPLATPTPTSLRLAQAHLQRIGIALALYSNDNLGLLPDDLFQLWEEGWLRSPRTFWNPGDSDPLPDDITNSEPDAPDSTQVSFEYLGAGLTYSSLTPDTVVLRDLSPKNNGGAGVNVLWGDFAVGFVLGDPCAADFNGDGLVNAFDLAELLGHWGVNPAHPGNFTGDAAIDAADLVILLSYWGSCN
ncbi:MAG: hypothetical protein IH895_00980 [Planctomycetes bacterium]|nr:hypothetical protein [Planctomycetota bacterium]